MTTTKLIATAVAVAVTAFAPAAADAAKPKPKPVEYVGKTKEGTKISFAVVEGQWVTAINTALPYSCVSAQGGPPTAGMVHYAPFRDFRLGAKDVKVNIEEPWPTKNYTITTSGKLGRAITGKLAANYSMTVGTSDYWRILTCNATGSFTAKPVKQRR